MKEIMTTYEDVVKRIQNHAFIRYNWTYKCNSLIDTSFRELYSFIDLNSKMLKPYVEQVKATPVQINFDHIQQGVRFDVKIGIPFQMADQTTPCLNLVHNCQHKYIARDMFCLVEPRTDKTVAVKALPHIKWNQKRINKIRGIRTNNTYQSLIVAFCMQRGIVWWPILDVLASTLIESQDINIFYWFLSQFYYDAAGFGPNATLDSKYRTVSVIGILKNIRQTEVFDMPILADALQDAGFGENENEVALLNHYRNDSIFGLGSWIFRATGLL